MLTNSEGRAGQMANKVRLTKTLLQAEQRAIRAAGKTRRLLWDDSEVAGFGARVSSKRIMFVFNYRHAAVERRMTIGKLGELTVEQAGQKAVGVKLGARDGADPLKETRDKRRLAESGMSLAAVVEQWMAASRSGWSSDTARLSASTLRKDVLPRLGDRDAESITRRE